MVSPAFFEVHMSIPKYPEHELYSRVKDLIQYEPGMKILDYGCGNGLLLRSGDIRPEDYTGLDVDDILMLENVENYPDATWLLEDMWSPCYNSNGVMQVPRLDQQYDIIFSNSVFTHMPYLHWRKAYQVFQQHTKRQVHSFCLQDNELCKKYFYDARVNHYGSCDELVFKHNCEYLVDNKLSPQAGQCQHFLAWYQPEELEQYGTLHRFDDWTLDFVCT